MAWFVLFLSSFPVHLVQSVAGQQLPSHIPLIKIGGQSRVMAGVTLQGGRRRFCGVLTAGGAHRRGGGGLVPRTGRRGRVRPLGFVHLKPRGRDGSELGASATPLGCSSVQEGHCEQRPGPARPSGSPCPATNAGRGPRTRLQHPSTRGRSHCSLAQPARTEPRSATRAARKETTPFPRAGLQPQPRQRGRLGPRWERGAQLRPALGE